MTARPKTPLAKPAQLGLEDLNQRLIETAAKLFAEQGYAETSMDQIAHATNAGKQSIYRRYPTKEHLFKAVVSEHFLSLLVDGWEQRLDEISRWAEGQSSSHLDVLRLACRNILDYILTPDARQMKRILIAEGWRFPAWAADIERATRAFESAIARYLSAARDAGEIPPYPARHTERALIGMLTGLSTLSDLVSGQIAPIAPAELDSFFDCAWALFLNGIRGGEWPRAAAPIQSTKGREIVAG